MGLIDKEYPSEIIADVYSRLEDSQENSHIGYFAGEFFDEDELHRLILSAKTRPIFLIEIEDISQLEDGDSADMRTPKDRVLINIYCAISNRQSEPAQQREAINLANEARRVLTGRKLPQADHRNRGFYKFSGITKEFTIVGLSVYRVQMYVDVHVDLDKVFIPTAFVGVLKGTFGKVVINSTVNDIVSKLSSNIQSIDLSSNSNNLITELSAIERLMDSLSINHSLSELSNQLTNTINKVDYSHIINNIDNELTNIINSLDLNTSSNNIEGEHVDPLAPFKTGNEVAIWTFEEQGQTLTDHSTNGHDALAGGSLSVEDEDPTPTSTGWDFDGIEDYASLSSEIVFNGAFEFIFAWRPDAFSINERAFGQSAGDPFTFRIDSTTKLSLRVGNEIATFTVPTMATGNNYIVALRKDINDDVTLRILGDTWKTPQNLATEFRLQRISNISGKYHDGEINFLRFSEGDSEASIDSQMLDLKDYLETERGMTITEV